jgi:hypothetical protein
MVFVAELSKKLAASPKHAILPRRWGVSIIARGFKVNPVTRSGYNLEMSRRLYPDSVSQNFPAFTSLRTVTIGEDIHKLDLNASKGLPALKRLIILGLSNQQPRSLRTPFRLGAGDFNIDIPISVRSTCCRSHDHFQFS